MHLSNSGPLGALLQTWPVTFMLPILSTTEYRNLAARVISLLRGGGFGGRGTPESPDEIAVDGEGNIYVVDRQAIYLLDVDGFRVLWDHDSFRVGGSPEQRDITVDSDGNIYVVRPAGNRLEIYGRRAVSVAPIPTPTPNLVLTPSPTMVPPRSGLLSSREAAPNGSLRCS